MQVIYLKIPKSFDKRLPLIKDLKMPREGKKSFFQNLFGKKKNSEDKDLISVYIITINENNHETSRENIVLDKELFRDILLKYNFTS